MGYVVDVKSTSLTPSPRQGQGLALAHTQGPGLGVQGGLVKESSSRVLATGTGVSLSGGGGVGGSGIGGYQGGVEVYVGTIIQIKEHENKVCVSYECEGAAGGGAPSVVGLTPAQTALEGQGLGLSAGSGKGQGLFQAQALGQG